MFVDGQVDLPREPPFNPADQSPAAIVTFQLLPEDPNLRRIFDRMYAVAAPLNITIHDGRGKWIAGDFHCVGVVFHRGIQPTRAWTPPSRSRDLVQVHALGKTYSGHPVYRASPRFQRIARDVYEYTLATAAWQDVMPIKPGGLVHASSADIH